MAAIDARRQRTKKRHHSDASSQSSQVSLYSSPPSSPVFVPKKSRASCVIQGESATETESDPDDGHVCIRERPSPSARGHGAHEAFSTRLTREAPSPISSDIERHKSHRKLRYEGLRDPYKLRSGPIHPGLSTVGDNSPSSSAQHLDSKDEDQLLSGQQWAEISATPKVNPSAVQGNKPEGKGSCSALGSALALSEVQSSDNLVTLLYCDEFLPEKGGCSGFDTESSCSSPASCIAPPSPSGVACSAGSKFRKQSPLYLSKTTHLPSLPPPSPPPPPPHPPPSPLLLPHISTSGAHQKKSAKATPKIKEKTVGQATVSSRPKSHGKVTSTLVTATVQALSDATLCKAPSITSPSASGHGSMTSEGTQTTRQTLKSSTGRSTPGRSASSAVGRSLSDSYVPSSPGYDQAGKRRSSANTSIVTRNRAQTIFEKVHVHCTYIYCRSCKSACLVVSESSPQ